ncbi:tyrosine-protein phosphatase [Emticicia sp. BO119]|uniref:tyrosine-protein phosphatase n=1 Tax=Emticicia sp. BO119 TaxID=2757768 RepID=UPI0015F0DE30|nr:CpsB/CapC family capsule biosynthesis tyrosine phosphatase [Emticicia sp. BO119]MBA4850541.1 histidinol phosphatase [Emticicia sp. BO119]
MFSFFSGGKTLTDAFSFLKTDIHSHLIPGIDDGSQAMKDTIQYIQELHKLGYKKLITTPHVKAGIYPNTPQTIHQGLKEVQEALQAQNIDIVLEAAAEYLLDEAFENILQQKEILCFGEKKYVLIEISFIAPPPNLSEIIFTLKTQGYRPIMAHPERYGYWWGHLNKVAHLKDTGCILQLNLLSLIGYYGKEVKQVAVKLLEADLIDFVGTDLHHERHLLALQQLAKNSKIMKLLKQKTFLNETL